MFLIVINLTMVWLDIKVSNEHKYSGVFIVLRLGFGVLNLTLMSKLFNHLLWNYTELRRYLMKLYSFSSASNRHNYRYHFRPKLLPIFLPVLVLKRLHGSFHGILVKNRLIDKIWAKFRFQFYYRNFNSAKNVAGSAESNPNKYWLKFIPQFSNLKAFY